MIVAERWRHWKYWIAETFLAAYVLGLIILQFTSSRFTGFFDRAPAFTLVFPVLYTMS